MFVFCLLSGWYLHDRCSYPRDVSWTVRQKLFKESLAGYTAPISLKFNVFESNFRLRSYQVSLSIRWLISVEINSIRTFDNSALDTNIRHEKQSSLDSNFRIEPSTRISLNLKVLTKVRQLCGNQKLTANCYQKLTANRYQKLTAKCNQNFSQKLTAICYQKFQSNLDTKSFNQKLIPKVSVKSWQ